VNLFYLKVERKLPKRTVPDKSSFNTGVVILFNIWIFMSSHARVCTCGLACILKGSRSFLSHYLTEYYQLIYTCTI